MTIRRDLWRQILAHLQPLPNGELDLEDAFPGEHVDILAAHVRYLADCGLVVSGFEPRDTLGADSNWIQKTETMLTARGHDYLSDDGGLTRELGTLVVRMDEEQVKAMLSDRVEQSTLPAAERSRLLTALRNAPAKALETLVAEVTKKGVESLPNVAQLLHSVLQ